MKIAVFAHAVASCWNNGNAHFLRGVCTALQRRGHKVSIHEPRAAWSRASLVTDHGDAALDGFAAAFPTLVPVLYDAKDDPEALIGDADLVLVHEWNEPALVNRIGAIRRAGGDFVLLFHDTHHRAATAPQEMRRFDLSGYDGVLAFGEAIESLYRRRGWAARVWTWHEAADTSIFFPRPAAEVDGDVVWIGNWGDGERSEEIRAFLLEPAEALGVKADIYGVRYPEEARAELARRGIGYRGWLANHRAPEIFAGYRMTVHVPRRPYASALPGIPTIRVFEALACGIPLVSAPWDDCEGLFPPGCYLVAEDGVAMRAHMRDVLADADLRAAMATSGLAAIRDRHTCDHRAAELLAIHASLAPAAACGSLPQGRLMRFAFFGSSLVSAYWNGAATYYRGLLKALAARGHEVSFFEPDAFERQAHRDIDDPDWARVTVFAPTETAMRAALAQAESADVVVKFSGVGVLDRELEAAVVEMRRPGRLAIFWDVDAPATLDAMGADAADPLRRHVPRYDAVFTYGGGDAVIEAYASFGARLCVPVYNAVDPGAHHPVPREARFDCDLAFLGNRLPDREARVDAFFLDAARRLPDRRFLLGGSGWGDKPMPANVDYLGHVYTRDHNALNATAKAVLNVNRDSMARYGASPPTRIFEAAGAAACIVTDAWAGIEAFLEPDAEILVAADGAAVAAYVEALDATRARAMGAAARRRVQAEHTYDHRALQVEALLDGRSVGSAALRKAV